MESKSDEKIIEGALLDVDYLNIAEESLIRLTIKGRDGKAYEIFDEKFKPYFYLVSSKGFDKEFVEAVSTVDNGRTIKSQKVEILRRSIFGKMVDAYKGNCEQHSKRTKAEHRDAAVWGLL